MDGPEPKRNSTSAAIAASLPLAPRLHGLSVFVAFSTLGLVAAGALVTSKGAGLAVPDWPRSYGHSLVSYVWWPEEFFSAENIRAEHGHRTFAGFVGILTVILTIAAWRSPGAGRAVRWIATAALAAVLLQALLGGLTVRNLLPPELSVSHALLAQIFFCLTVTIALLTSRGWRRGSRAGGSSRTRADAPDRATRALAVGLVALLFAQLFVGALSRHLSKDSGLALHEFPRSFQGAWAPPLDAESLGELNAARRALGFPEDVGAAAVALHFAHRVGAVAVTLFALIAGLRVLRRRRDRAELLFPAMAIWLLLVLQIALGVAAVASFRQPHITTAHVAVGAATLGAAVVLCLQAFRLEAAEHGTHGIHEIEKTMKGDDGVDLALTSGGRSREVAT
jgi:cytochrome c oxidase assembly protein subunit 15